MTSLKSPRNGLKRVLYSFLVSPHSSLFLSIVHSHPFLIVFLHSYPFLIVFLHSFLFLTPSLLAVWNEVVDRQMWTLKVVGKSFGHLLVGKRRGIAASKNRSGVSVTSTKGKLDVLIKG